MEMAISKMGLILTAVLLVMPGVPGVDGRVETVAHVGQDAVLECPSAESHNALYPDWVFVHPLLGDHHLHFYADSGGRIKPEYIDRVSYAANNISLTIKNITLLDAGDYDCWFTVDSHQLERITLHVWNTPVISNQSADGTVTGTEDRSLTLTCTCTGGENLPKMTWYRDTTQSTALASSHSLPLEDDMYTISNTYTFTPDRDDDGSVYICQLSSRLEVLDNVLDNVSAHLRLNLRPSQPRVEQRGDVVAGSNATLWCTTSGFRPMTTITVTWRYNGSPYTPVTTTILDSDTDTYTGMSTLLFTLQKADNGGRAECIVAHSTLETPLTGTAIIDVHYPPDVIATTTTTDQYLELTCSPSGGVPNTYMYSSWKHTWPGYGEITRPLLAAAPTLRLYNLTYADSGIYTCRVSNGVAPYGTIYVIRTGSTEAITIKSRAQIVNPSTTGTDILKFVVKLNQPTSVNVTYYSTSDPTSVRCYFVIGTVRQSPSIGTVKTDKTQIDLPMFNSIVPTLGTRATVTWSIPGEFGLGFYEVVLTNDVGEASVVMEAVIEGPPTRPANLQTTNGLYTSVDVSWQLGFHGGYPQTCVLEYSTNEVTWTEGATLDTGLSTSRAGHHVTVDSLRPGTNYYLRMYAYNQLGSSPHTYTLNVTTSGVQDGYSGAGGESMSLFAAGAVGAGAVLVICAVGFIVLYTMYRKGYMYIGRNGKHGAKHSEETNMNETVIGGAPRQVRGVPDESGASALANIDEAPATYEELKPSARWEDDTKTYTELELYETTDRQQEVYENMKI